MAIIMKTAIGLLLTLTLFVNTNAICPESIDGLKRWSDASTWVGGIPIDNETVIITEGILLDTVTSRLGAVFVSAGGRLVFDPEAELAKLVTDRLDIGNEGYVDIGSPDCEFLGKAEILLTGTRTSDDNNIDLEFGEKFIGVREGGSLEIHGQSKKSWTKLAATIPAANHPYSAAEKQPWRYGLYLYEFDRITGKRIDMDDANARTNKMKFLNAALDRLKSDSTIIMINRGTNVNTGNIRLFETDQWNLAVNKLEAKFGCTLDIIRSWNDEDEAWTLVVDRSGQTATCIEEMDHFEGSDDLETETNKITHVIGEWEFSVQNRISMLEDGGNYRLDLEVFEEGHDENTITVIDDISSWNIGDRIVLASTDYNFNQAEEVEVVSIIDATTLKVKGTILYEHFGEIYEGVDMRGEVGLLTRNILIHGEMGTKCTGGDLNQCPDMPFDSFGGHTKAVKGFKAYNIVGAELTNMGQTAFLGRYPIHFHMCEDVDGDGPNPLIASNSIHHCLSRCITVHGTHGVHIKDNVAHDTIGHCYFLEDGGEKRTVYDGNLGLTTRKGSLIPSDTNPTTFWITSPLTTFINNVAAGSDNSGGFGIWFLFPDEPTSKSFGLGFFQLQEAKHTLITEWRNNVAHSNGDKGFALFRRLREDHGILGCSTYDPWNDPLKKESGKAPVIFDGFTGYKNRKTNVILRSTTVEARNFRLAESAVGIRFERNMLSGYQLLVDSTIIGETPNTGEGQRIKVEGKWKYFDESLPLPNSPTADMSGIYLHAEGPLHIRNVEFKNLKHNDLRKGCGITFRDKFNQGMALSSSVKGLSFNYDDGEGNYVCHANRIEGYDESSMMLKDLDGSLTGTAGLKVVSSNPIIHDGMDCDSMGDWNMSVCHGDFARFYVFPKPEQVGANYLAKLENLPTVHQEGHSVEFVGYTVNTDQIYVLSYKQAVPRHISLRAPGLESQQSFILGFCLPMSLANLVKEGTIQYYQFIKEVPFEVTQSLDELKSDDSLVKNVFFDLEKGILFFKFAETRIREEGFLGDCLGSLEAGKNCPMLKLSFKHIVDQLDMSDNDCSTR